MKDIQAELAIKSIPGDAERKALDEINRLKEILDNRNLHVQALEKQVDSLKSELSTIKKGMVYGHII